MKITVANSEQFERLLHALAKDIVDATVHSRLLRALLGDISAYEAELNQSRAFWSLTINAHLAATRLCLFRVYDQRPGTLSLRNWLETIEENQDLFGAGGSPTPDVLKRGAKPPDMQRLQQDLREVAVKDALVKKLIIQRGAVFAHTNADNVIQQISIEERFPISWKELYDLVDRARSILNRYSQLFKQHIFSGQIIGHDDYRFVLDAVRSYGKQIELDIQREIDAARP